MSTHDKPNYQLIPPHRRQEVENYVELGEPVGDFLRSILVNDFATAWRVSSVFDQSCFKYYLQFLVEELNPSAWGSLDKYYTWLEHHGWSAWRKEEKLCVERTESA